MVTSFESEPLISFAIWAVAGASALAAFMMLHIAWVRARLSARVRRETRFLARWRPLLLESIDSMPLQLKSIKRRDWQTFLALWSSFFESVRGPARHRLKAMALRMRMDLAARALLDHGTTRDELLAVETLGSLGDGESWNTIEQLAKSDHSLLSLTAARALLMIDAQRAIDLLIPELIARDDWPLARVMALLTDVGPEAVSRPLATAIDFATPAQLPRLISLMDCANAEIVAPQLLRLLEISDDHEILVACLKSVHAPRDPALLSGLARHSSWQVRTQCARLLGLVANPGDETLLIPLLADPVWWVRYRAARALAELSFLSRDDLWRMRFLLTDRFAQNILDQAVAERRDK